MGNYQQLIIPSGPPEIRRSSEEANELARTLGRLSHDNRSLLRKIVSLQDDERRDMARELHDELGPLLFGIRANAVALLDDAPQDKAELESSVQALVASVEALQQANRRILDRLRPLYIQELGLEKSIADPAQKCPRAGARPRTDLADRSRAERCRRPAFPNGLSDDPGRRHQRSAARPAQARCGSMQASKARR